MVGCLKYFMNFKGLISFSFLVIGGVGVDAGVVVVAFR